MRVGHVAIYSVVILFSVKGHSPLCVHFARSLQWIAKLPVYDCVLSD